MKKIIWAKKQIIILIVSIIAVIAVIAGSVAAILLTSDSSGTKRKKKIIKKVIVVQNEDENSEDSDADDSEDDGYYFDDEYEDSYSDSSDETAPEKPQKENFFIKIIKRIKNTFGHHDIEEDVVSYNNLEYGVKTLYAKDFGAVGDGVKDDGKAIADAVQAVCNSGPGSKLKFEANKKYFIEKGTMLGYAMHLDGVKGITIDGNGSEFILKGNNSFITLVNSKDCVLKNMEFDYKIKPAFTAQFKEIRPDKKSALMVADRDINLQEGQTYTSTNRRNAYFGVLNKHDSRHHVFLNNIKLISKKDRLIEVNFRADANTNSWLGMTEFTKKGMILPMPEYGHIIERGFTLSGNDGFKMENVDIHSCCTFAMLISNNSGECYFNNVDMTPADNDLDRDMYFTSWRDVFHCKDNRAKLHWSECDIKANYDDVYNISSSTCYLDDYNIAKNRIKFLYKEGGGKYHPVRPGDEINIIDTELGVNCGTAKIKRVISQSTQGNVVTLEKPLTSLNSSGEHMLVYLTSHCAPGSTIDKCNFEGTYRFRGPIDITNTNFVNYATWIDVYSNVEGPVPNGIHYKNCRLTCMNPSSMTDKNTIVLKSFCPSEDEFSYHINDIRFEDCTMLTDQFETTEFDQQFVTIKNCKKPDGSKIPDQNAN